MGRSGAQGAERGGLGYSNLLLDIKQFKHFLVKKSK